MDPQFIMGAAILGSENKYIEGFYGRTSSSRVRVPKEDLRDTATAYQSHRRTQESLPVLFCLKGF